MELGDTREVLTRLGKSTAQIKGHFAIIVATLGVWLLVEVILLFHLEWRREFLSRFWHLAFSLSTFAIVIANAWRIGGRSGDDQKLALEEMRERADVDPLAFEEALPRLKRLSRKLSPTAGENHLLAQAIVERVERARVEVRELPIVHEWDRADADFLPRVS